MSDPLVSDDAMRMLMAIDDSPLRLQREDLKWVRDQMDTIRVSMEEYGPTDSQYHVLMKMYLTLAETWKIDAGIQVLHKVREIAMVEETKRAITKQEEKEGLKKTKGIDRDVFSIEA